MKKNKSKGDRLNWTPLKDVKPVRLTENLTKGERVHFSSPNERSRTNTNQKVFLVP